MSRKSFVWLGIFISIVNTGPTACSLNDLLEGNAAGGGNLGGPVDPKVVTSYTGALGMYYAAVGFMRAAVNTTSYNTAILTDELYVSFGADYTLLDGRVDPQALLGNVADGGYPAIQKVRVQAAQASAALLKHGTPASYPLVGHAYALQAHAILILAELFCSGVPLTSAPLGGDLTYTEGLPTATLLERAVALFDTAYQYGKDSLPIATFAKVGKGRALLDLGRYAEARAAVADVSTNSRYVLEFNGTFGGSFFTNPEEASYQRFATLSPEGGNGIRWVAPTPELQDPRIPFETNGSGFVIPLKQKKYLSSAINMIVADGIQARMIEAEADLQPADAPKGQWLQPLNAARNTRGLSDTTDPGTKDGRINLLFRERAFWFYLNGQRLGDMRRLMRQYGRLQQQVFPVGAYLNSSITVPSYGTEIVLVPSKTEQQYNPLYKGCISKGA